MARYVATIHIWAHSTGEGQGNDQARCGEPVVDREVTADSMREALDKVELFTRGIQTNPMVWRTPIYKIERVGD